MKQPNIKKALITAFMLMMFFASVFYFINKKIENILAFCFINKVNLYIKQKDLKYLIVL